MEVLKDYICAEGRTGSTKGLYVLKEELEVLKDYICAEGRNGSTKGLHMCCRKKWKY